MHAETANSVRRPVQKGTSLDPLRGAVPKGRPHPALGFNPGEARCSPEGTTASSPGFQPRGCEAQQFELHLAQPPRQQLHDVADRQRQTAAEGLTEGGTDHLPEVARPPFDRQEILRA